METTVSALQTVLTSCELCACIATDSIHTEGECYHCTGSRQLLALKLSVSAKKGCAGCELLRNAAVQWFEEGQEEISQDLPQNFDELWEILVLEVWPSGPNEPLRIKMLAQTDEHQYYEICHIELFTTEISSPWPAIKQGRSLSQDHTMSKTLDLCDKFLQNCLTSHHGCSTSELSPLPTRLVKVGDESCLPSIYELNGQTGSYAALSYCWGVKYSAQEFETSTSTLPQLKMGFTLTTLPKTYQEAILICRRLGIEYIWIDCLCILQDSLTDWATESQNMGDIFANSVVTIAAAGADSRDGGCFINNPDHCQRTEMVKFSMVDKYPVYIRKSARYPYFAHSADSIFRCQLHSRGWTLQEHVLAPRILHFTLAEVVFECNSALTCECQMMSVPRTYRHDIRDSVINGKRDIDFNWYEMVQLYTLRHLTKAKDRLPALSGLAAIFADRTSWTYVAGLWAEDLTYGLLWATIPLHSVYFPYVRDSDMPKIEKQLEYHAPSWSWASINGAVEWKHPEPSYREKYFVSMLPSIPKITYDLASPNMYGAWVNGTLSIESFVVPVYLWAQSERIDEVIAIISMRKECKSTGELSQSVPTLDEIEEISPCIFGNHRSDEDDEVPLPERAFGNLDFDIKTEQHIDTSQQFRLVLIGYDARPPYRSWIEENARGLVVAYVGENKWRRIGLLTSYNCDWDKWKSVADVEITQII